MTVTTDRNKSQNPPSRAGGTMPLNGRRSSERGLRTKSRRTGLVAVAALLIVGCGLGFAVMLSQAGHKTSVLSMGSAVPKGHVVQRGDLVTQQVAGVGGAIEVADVSRVVGKTAVVDLVPGQILTDAMITADPVPGAGKATVGLSLDPSQVPAAGLEAGDVVSVIAVPGANGGDSEALEAPPVLADDAQVYDLGGTSTEGATVMVTLIVDASDASRIAAYSTSKRVAVIETSASDSGGSP